MSLSGAYNVQSSTDPASSLTDVLHANASPGLVAVYLFGSHAEGRAHRQSDIDLGVLLCWNSYPDAKSRFEERLRLTNRLMEALGSPVDLVILNDAPPLLGRHIVTRGRRIYCTDTKTDHAYVRDIQLRAADLEPFLRRMQKIKLQALRR